MVTTWLVANPKSRAKVESTEPIAAFIGWKAWVKALLKVWTWVVPMLADPVVMEVVPVVPVPVVAVVPDELFVLLSTVVTVVVTLWTWFVTKLTTFANPVPSEARAAPRLFSSAPAGTPSRSAAC